MLPSHTHLLIVLALASLAQHSQPILIKHQLAAVANSNSSHSDPQQLVACLGSITDNSSDNSCCSHNRTARNLARLLVIKLLPVDSVAALKHPWMRVRLKTRGSALEWLKLKEAEGTLGLLEADTNHSTGSNTLGTAASHSLAKLHIPNSINSTLGHILVMRLPLHTLVTHLPLRTVLADPCFDHPGLFSISQYKNLRNES